jgi:hypothetical protein
LSRKNEAFFECFKPVIDFDMKHLADYFYLFILEFSGLYSEEKIKRKTIFLTPTRVFLFGGALLILYRTLRKWKTQSSHSLTVLNTILIL